MISIVNYGMGNLASIQNMLKKVGVASELVTTPAEVDAAKAVIIPGVGKFDHAMTQLESMGLKPALDDAALARRIPVLGICLGMQLMTRGSEEGERPGLGWIKAMTRQIDGPRWGLRVPHMGWNLIQPRGESRYFSGDGLGEHRYYFVHSYAVYCDDPADVLATTRYGDDFVSAFSCGNLVGVQFHPEKSHKFGGSFLRRYAAAHGLAEEPALSARR